MDSLVKKKKKSDVKVKRDTRYERVGEHGGFRRKRYSAAVI